jgi:hypothetical protein
VACGSEDFHEQHFWTGLEEEDTWAQYFRERGRCGKIEWQENENPEGALVEKKTWNPGVHHFLFALWVVQGEYTGP